jgi:pSer/pThr/pTyr-binding forkhead associated (FHA) protein
VKWLRLNGQTHPLRQGESTIGRSPYCSIQISSDQASREHAAVSLNGDVVVIADLGSRNGTFINGVRIAEPTQLLPGALIGIGGLSISYFEGESSPEPLHLGRTRETPALTRDMLETTFPDLQDPKDS